MPGRPGCNANAGAVLDLLLEFGRAAENANAPGWPGYGRVGGKRVNVGHYRAAQHVLAHPDLMSPDEVPAVGAYASAITAGTLPDLPPGEIVRDPQ